MLGWDLTSLHCRPEMNKTNCHDISLAFAGNTICSVTLHDHAVDLKHCNTTILHTAISWLTEPAASDTYGLDKYIQHCETYKNTGFMHKMKNQRIINNLWLKCTSWMKTLAKWYWVWQALSHAKSWKAGKASKLHQCTHAQITYCKWLRTMTTVWRPSSPC